MDKKTVTLQLFMKTGGPQPDTYDAEDINKYILDTQYFMIIIKEKLE